MLLSIAALAVLLGGLAYRGKRQQASIRTLRELGGQLEYPDQTLANWIHGMSIDNLQFLGPKVGDESIDTIKAASSTLNLKRITFVETRISNDGLHDLQAHLPNVQIKSVMPMQGLPRPERIR